MVGSVPYDFIISRTFGNTAFMRFLGLALSLPLAFCGESCPTQREFVELPLWLLSLLCESCGSSPVRNHVASAKHLDLKHLHHCHVASAKHIDHKTKIFSGKPDCGQSTSFLKAVKPQAWVQSQCVVSNKFHRVFSNKLHLGICWMLRHRLSEVVGDLVFSPPEMPWGPREAQGCSRRALLAWFLLALHESPGPVLVFKETRRSTLTFLEMANFEEQHLRTRCSLTPGVVEALHSDHIGYGWSTTRSIWFINHIQCGYSTISRWCRVRARAPP